MGSTTGIPEKQCDAVTHTRTRRHIMAPPHAEGIFLRVWCTALLQHQQFWHKVALGLQTAFSKAVSKRRKEGGMYPARVPGVQTHRCFQPRLPSSSLGHPAVAPDTDHTTLRVLIWRKGSLSWHWKYSAFTFTALHRFLQLVPRQVQALSSTPHTFLLKTHTHTSPHIHSGHTQITILSFLRSLKETLSC